MLNHQPYSQNPVPAIADAEWMMIHCDTFISPRERILLTENAFKIDRDLQSVAKPLSDSEINNYSETSQQNKAENCAGTPD